MAVSRAGRSSCGNEHSNDTHPVGPEAPRPCKAYFRRAGESREFDCLYSKTKVSHANQTTWTCFLDLILSSVLICIQQGKTQAQPEAEVRVKAYCINIFSEGPINFQARVSSKCPGATIFTRLGPGDKCMPSSLWHHWSLSGALPSIGHMIHRL
jgi:hypothetical protein